MVQLSPTRIAIIEARFRRLWQEYVSSIGRNDPLPTLQPFAGTGSLPALADKLGIPWPEFETYALLKEECHHLSVGSLPEDCEDPECRSIFPTGRIPHNCGLISGLARVFGMQRATFARLVEKEIKACRKKAARKEANKHLIVW